MDEKNTIEIGEVVMKKVSDYVRGNSAIHFVCPRCKTQYAWSARDVAGKEDQLVCVFDKTPLERDTTGPEKPKSVIERTLAEKKKETPQKPLYEPTERRILFFFKEDDPICNATSHTLLHVLDDRSDIVLEPVKCSESEDDEEGTGKLALVHGVKSFPTVVFLRDKEEVARIEGFKISTFSIRAAVSLL